MISSNVQPANSSSDRPRITRRPASPSTSESTVSAATTPSNPSTLARIIPLITILLEVTLLKCHISI